MVGQPRDRGSSPGTGKRYVYAEKSTLALGSIQPRNESAPAGFSTVVKRKAVHSPLSCTLVKNEWSYTSTLVDPG
jgi:hypothetical protein